MVTSLRVWIRFQFQSDFGAVESRPARWSEVHRPETGAVGTVLILGSATVTTPLRKEGWNLAVFPVQQQLSGLGQKEGQFIRTISYFFCFFVFPSVAKLWQPPGMLKYWFGFPSFADLTSPPP